MDTLQVKSDLHTHTLYSHGKGTPEENVLAAIKLGLERIAISEHASGHIFYGVRGEKLAALRRETDRLARKYASDIEVLMGYECDLTAFGECDAPVDRSMFDVLLLAYHKGVFARDAVTLRCAAESFHIGHADPVRVSEALLAAADKYRIDIFSHPCTYVRADIPTLAKGAAELGVLLELNGSHTDLTPDDVRLAASYGARFCVNSDAHTPERVGDFKKGLAIAEAAGIDIVEWESRTARAR